MDEMVGPDTRDWPDTDEERGFRMDFTPPVPCYATLLEATVKAMRFASQSKENWRARRRRRTQLCTGHRPRSCRFGCQGWFSDKAFTHNKEQ